MTKNIGRPSKILEKERVDEFLALINDGVDFNIAADTARIARSTVFEWLRKGRDIQNNLMDMSRLTSKEQAFLDFLERFMRARVAPEVRAVGIINSSVEKGSWRAAAWVLEHRYPERWSMNRSIDENKNVVSSNDFVLNSQLESKIHAVLRMSDHSKEGRSS